MPDPTDDSAIEAIGAIEAIKQLKARYFRFIDTKDWEGWADLFTADAVMDVSDDPGSRGVVHGRDAIVEGVSQVLATARTIHHGHMPEIELTGPTTARGIWSMEDEVDFSAEGEAPSGIRGAGWYHEEYRLEDGVWRIAFMRLERLRREPLE